MKKMIQLEGLDLVDVLFKDIEFRKKIMPKEPEQAKFKVEERLRGTVHPARLKEVDRGTFEKYLYDALEKGTVDHMDVVRALKEEGYLWMAANYATVNNVEGADDVKIATVKAVLIPGSSYFSSGEKVSIGYDGNKVERGQAVHDLTKQFGLESKFDEIVEDAFREVAQEDKDTSVLVYVASFGIKREVVEEEGLALLARRQSDYRASQIVSELELPVDKALAILRPEYEKWLSIYHDEIELAKRKGQDTRHVSKPNVVGNYEEIQKQGGK